MIGTGRETRIDAAQPLAYLPSKIVQTANNTAIFKIGQDINDVAIRDLGLTASTGVTGAVGILAQNGTTEATSGQSLGFDFSDLTFENLDKGIYVNAQAFSTNSQIPGIGAEGGWRFDNVRLEKIRFQNCRIGVHVNSNNSGWSMKNLLLEVPAGPQIPLPVYNPTATPQYSGGMGYSRHTGKNRT